MPLRRLLAGLGLLLLAFLQPAQAQDASPRVSNGASLAIGALDQKGADHGGPALWRVTDEDSEVWLFGSVHMLEPGLDWRRPALAEALEAADVVYFEAPTDLAAQAKVQFLLIEIGFNPPGATLSNQLSPEGAELLAKAAQDLKTPLATLEAMRPWLALMTISAQQAASAGADPSYGVETQLGIDALKAGKEIRNFETLEQQTRFFAEMSHEAQIAMLEETLRHLDEAVPELDNLVSAWTSGDTEQLERLVFHGVEDLPPEFHEVVFTRRNHAWAEEIETLLEGSEDALIVVGAGHLLGPDSVLALLRSKGYDAERF